MNKLRANSRQWELARLELNALRRNRTATQTNFKRVYNKLEPLERQLLINVIKARQAFKNRPRGNFGNVPLGIPMNQVAAHMNRVRTAQRNSENKAFVTRMYFALLAKPGIPSRKAKTIQRFARGFITRKRLNNPTWGKPSYSNVVRTGNARPLGTRAVYAKLFKHI